MAAHLPEGLSPDSVDTLTELASIIVKLRSSQSSVPGGGISTPALGNTTLPGAPGTGATPSHVHGGPTSGATPAPGAVTGTTPLPSGPSSSNPNALSVKELPAATDNLKHKLQKARALVKTLPDVNRTIAQQEEEIKELEERRKRQIAMLAKIRDEGLQFAAVEQRRRDDEGERMVE